MLEPDDRTLLLDALRPPDGFELDTAVATTFTLDLDALLVAPLAFTLYDWIAEDGKPDPLAMLESLRRYADRTTVFCQAGEVGFRAAYRPLVVLVEDSVIPVSPPTVDAVFHPKLWALRFVDPDGSVRHRLLVLSRNLTFDRSWDSLLRLDGELDDEPVEASAPLASMIRQLPTLATAEVPAVRAEQVLQLADELDQVRFEPPPGFTDLSFHPIGVGEGWPLREEYDRALVVSPFLSRGTLGRIGRRGGDHVLISSAEALDGVGRAATTGFESVHVLSPAALPADATEDSADAEVHPSDGEPTGVGRPELDGLHAKLFLLEHGDAVSLYTGSANATDAAFHGNVELLVELTGSRDDHGIEALLRHGGEREPTFRTLLEEYRPAEEGDEDPTDEELVAIDLDRLRRSIARLEFVVHLEPDGVDYRASVVARGTVPGLLAELTKLQVWPLSLGAGSAKPLRPGDEGLGADLGRLSIDGITAFLAIEAVLERGEVEESSTFVVPARLEGAPEGRSQRVLSTMLRNREDLLRYLLFLLADGDLDLDVLIEALSGTAKGQARELERVAPPLFETMLKTLARDPRRLDHVSSLLADLQADGRHEELLPEDFDAVWEPIWAVREELET